HSSEMSQSWKEPFAEGVSCFKKARYSNALQHFDEAINSGGDQQYAIFDSRAAVYEKLEKGKEALRDARKVIQLAPNRWQGYSRAARLFLGLRKADEALVMVDLALAKTKPADEKRRAELLQLKELAQHCRRRYTCYIAKLPVELVSEIFACLASENHLQVLTVAAVSSHWRRIALSTPSLWSCLVLTKKDPVRKTQWWTERSKGRIHELFLHKSLLGDFDWDLSRLQGLHWPSLRICRLQDWDLHSYLTQISMSSVFPNLDELHIQDTSYRGRRDPLFAYPDTKLRSLSLHGASFTMTTIQDLNNLTTLVLKDIVASAGITIASLVAILTANPLLRTFILQFGMGTTLQEPKEELTPIVHQLKQLELGACHGLPPLFDSVAFPDLEQLALTGPISAIDSIFHILHQKRSHKLIRLSIQTCALNPGPIVELLRDCSQLETLIMKSLYKVAKGVIDALGSPGSKEEVPCPNLKYLDLSGCGDVKAGPLSRVVTSRMTEDRDHGIETLIVDKCPLIDSEFLPWFRENVKLLSCIYETKKQSRLRR
ncbi:hypothetical protein C8J56DRAFT_911192, partial [Mycena floridula]